MGRQDEIKTLDNLTDILKILCFDIETVKIILTTNS